MSYSAWSITIRVWLKTFLVGGVSWLPRATSLMQKNTSWRSFVRCFYIKQFSSTVSVCQWEIKCIYFPVYFREGFFARCEGFSHVATDGRECWNPCRRAWPHSSILPNSWENIQRITCLCSGFAWSQFLVLPGVDIKGSFANYGVNHGINPRKGRWETASLGFQRPSLSERCRCALLFYSKHLSGLMLNLPGFVSLFLHYVCVCHSGWLR